MSTSTPDIVIGASAVSVEGPFECSDVTASGDVNALGGLNAGTNKAVTTPTNYAFSVDQNGDVTATGTLAVGGMVTMQNSLTVDGMIRANDVQIGGGGAGSQTDLSTALGQLAILEEAVKSIMAALKAAKITVPDTGTGSGGLFGG